MAPSTRFIIIDDDQFNNKICSVTIEKMSDDAEVISFLDPVVGFDYVVSEYSDPADKDARAILLLDINMPVMNGWEFLERFDTLSNEVKERISIYILSSSVDKRDIERAKTNTNVIHYLIKPLTRETIREVMEANG